MSKSMSEIPMTKVKLKYPFVEAIEVDARYVYSLPNAGSVLQRFGEQVEILHDGPVKKKTYAQIGEYILAFEVQKPGANYNVVEYVVLSAVAYKSLFEEADNITEVQTGIRDITEPLTFVAPPVEAAPVSPPPASAKPLSEAEKKIMEKEEARRKRMQELQNVDTDGLEKSLADGAPKA
jgi:hypothetical protein